MAKWNEATQQWEFEPGELEAQAEAALADEQGHAGEAQALRVAFHARTRRFTVYRDNGVNFSFPADLCEGLSGKSPQALKNVVVLPDGDTLEWPRLDVHLSVTGLALGLLGSAGWMERVREEVRQDAVRRAGRATSDKKRASSAANGKLGGRPRKTAQAKRA